MRGSVQTYESERVYVPHAVYASEERTRVLQGNVLVPLPSAFRDLTKHKGKVFYGQEPTQVENLHHNLTCEIITKNVDLLNIYTWLL